MTSTVVHQAGENFWLDGGIWVPSTGATAGSCAPLCLQDTMEYKKKQRPLKIRMLDGTVKTVMVDDSKTVTDMLMTICARIGEERTATGRKKGGGERMAESDRLLGSSSSSMADDLAAGVCDTGKRTLLCTPALLHALCLAEQSC